jgi:hypothetical protein
MDEQPESGISQGSAHISLGMPVIQMGALLHPQDLGHARAVDVALALTVLQADVALLRAEVTVLKVAVISELEHLALMRREHTAALGEIQRAQAMLFSRIRTFDERLTAAEVQRSQDLERYARIVAAQIDTIPETFLWNRFKSWLQRCRWRFTR